jgi:FdhD protein
MKIRELYTEFQPETIKEMEYREVCSDGQTAIKKRSVLVEHVIDIYINHILTMKLICIPTMLTELVLGRLLTEGMISSAEDVEEIYICRYGKQAFVTLRTGQETEVHPNDHREPAFESLAARDEKSYEQVIAIEEKSTLSNREASSKYIETTPSCCTGNRVLNDYFIKELPRKKIQAIRWKAEWIYALSKRFEEGMPLHSKTGATHSCFLMKEGEIVFTCEDIGRHNALDKAIGYALRHGIDLKTCIAFSSGRIPTDMAEKAIAAGIPILATKASVSDAAIALAEEYGLTLLGKCRRREFAEFTGSRPYFD